MASKAEKGKRKLLNGSAKMVPEDGYHLSMNGRIMDNGNYAVKASLAPQRLTNGVASGADHSAVYMSDTLVFYVNGKEVKDNKVDPSWTLLYYLRSKLKLCGTKLGCAEGGCGACTVMVSSYDHVSRKITHLAVNACLTPVCAMHGLAVTTVEGIGSTRTRLHPVQERLAKSHGSQCGFCTPGFVMSMYALLRSIPKPTMEHLEVAFQGNLCRCTGYRPILEGFRTFTEEWEHSRLQSLQPDGCNGENQEKGVCGMGDQCCRRKKAFTSEAPSELVDSSAFTPYDPTQEPIFPPKLQTSPELNEQYLIIQGKEVTWYRPTKLGEILVLKDQYPNAKIIVGNTEVGVEVKFKHFVYPVLIQPTRVKEMCEILENKHSLKIGASVTLMELEDALREQIRVKPEHQTRIFSEVVEMLHWFAGKQIRNVAAVGGNIMTGSPISDLVPIFMATGVKLNLCSYRRGYRTVPLDHTFFTGYRRNVVQADELLVSLEIPFTGEHQHLVAYKQAKRREDDIAVVNMALNVSFHPGTSVVKEATMVFGGMAPVTKVALKTCRMMVGRRWDVSLLEPVFDSLVEELPLSGDAPGGMILYRRSLTLSLFLKGFVRVAKRLQRAGVSLSDTSSCGLPRELEDADERFRFQAPRSSQYFQLVPLQQPERDLIGRPIVHASALKQATGEAVYCDDLPKFEDELYLSFVTSAKARAKILRIDPSQALEVEGVVAFFDANDIPEDRRWIGAAVHDEEVFASKEVFSQGQVIGAVVAVDQATAQKAARLVRVEYEELQPVIVSIEDAIRHESYYPDCPRRIIQGNAEEAFLEAENVLEGEIRMGGQEHFYFETHASIAVPKENELEMFCSTQHPSEIQRIAAHVLGLHCNRINVRVKRIGGGFGGKESRGLVVAIPVAFAAYRLGKPVRCMLDRDEDMQMSGTRHPFLFRYKVGFDNNGLLKVAQIHIYCNAGYSADLSLPVLQRAMLHFENAYKIPVSDVYGYFCKTNLPSNTAFRGFGGPQGMFAAENIIRDVANYLGLDPVKVSELNLYKEGDLTHYNQLLDYCTLQRCWKECLQFSNYRERFEAVQKFNKEHRYRKRGISVIPTKFGIAFTLLFLNQAGALVHIYTDGSVLISHGGIEMGQGVHTKVIQIASRIFKVHPDKIHVSETATDKVPNTSATAASIGSDINGMAVMEACNRIMERLTPIIEKNPTGTWEQWIQTAYMERVSLSASGFYRTPGLGYDWSTNSGNAFNYFTYGVACTEVEIDCLTGDHQLLRTDIVMDLGESMNPAIDIGQVEGAFVQGYGLFTLEEMIYSPSGTVYSRGPGAYKIPALADIPREFNVSLLKESQNPRAVYSSKAVGEPPLFLASSAFFAIKEAIMSARRDAKIPPYFRLDSPATAAKIRTACVDDLIKRVDKPDGKQPWNVTA